MRRTAFDAQQTRERIIGTAINKASVDGLDGLTIGSLAEAVGMSKAGVIKPFGSRHNLQLAVISRVKDMFTESVISPCISESPGISRLGVLIDAWCDYLGACPFPGGCFITAASCEVDARPGELHDALREMVGRWLTFLSKEVEVAQNEGSIESDIDPDDCALILNGIAMATNQKVQLFAEPSAADRARHLMASCLGLRPATSQSD